LREVGKVRTTTVGRVDIPQKTFVIPARRDCSWSSSADDPARFDFQHSAFAYTSKMPSFSKPAPPAAPIWDDATLHSPHARADKAERVQRMFDAIAPTYERVNAVASFGQDARWRRRAVALARVTADDVVLDVCCGTGDMLRTFDRAAPAPRLLIGADFAGQMLACGTYERMRTPLQLCRADGLRLPLASGSVDVVTCAFGVRNFQDLDAGLAEFHRVLKPGGRCVILEFSLPENALIRAAYRFYCERVLPRVGGLLSGDRSGAYRYLPQSIRTFERRAEMIGRLGRAGFTRVRAEPMNCGGVVAYLAE
jgi:demethylmenaquinone methyltransferase / 2-methoxy-6-polyprenyl-1,4-benzoquinol methylase